MTKKDLVKVIQEVVRREVQKEVKQIFINEGIHSLKTKQRTTLKSTAPSVKRPIQKKVVKKRKSVNYTSNESLNSILNETVGLNKTQNEFEEYPTMGGETFDKSKMQELMGYGQSDEGRREMAAIDTLKKAGKSVSDVPEHITDALTKDYSGLMKALDKKKVGGLG